MPRALRTPYVLLTKHFLRQFLENDLISPDADRTQLLAVVGALVISMTLFISAFMTSVYIGAFLTPGQAAILSLDDKYFYLALAMVVTALVAASQWDVLAIDPRDAAILEPLPVPAGTIRRAKVTAVTIMGAAVAVAVNGFPSWIFPWMLSFNFPQMRVAQLFGLMAAHALVHRDGGDVRLPGRHRAARNHGGAARTAPVRDRLAVDAGRADRGARQLVADAADRRRSRRPERLRRLAHVVAADVVSRSL